MIKNIRKIFLIAILGTSLCLVSCGGNKKIYTWVDFKLAAQKESIKNIVTNKYKYNNWSIDDTFSKVSAGIPDDDDENINIKISDDTIHEIANFNIQYFENSIYNVDLWSPSNRENNYYSWNLFLKHVDIQLENSKSINEVVNKQDKVKWPNLILKQKIIQTPNSVDNGTLKYRVIFEIQKSKTIEEFKTYSIFWNNNNIAYVGEYNIDNWGKYGWDQYKEDALNVLPLQLLKFCNPKNWYNDISQLSIEQSTYSDENHNVYVKIKNNDSKKELNFTSMTFNVNNPIPYTSKNSKQWNCNEWNKFLTNSEGRAHKNDTNFKIEIIIYLKTIFRDKMSGWDSSQAKSVIIKNIISNVNKPNVQMTFENDNNLVRTKILNLVYWWDGLLYSSNKWELNIFYKL